MCVSLAKHGMILWAQLERGSQSRTWAGRKEAAILERHGWGGRGNFNVKNGLKMVKVRMTREQIREAGLLNALIHICALGKGGIKWHIARGAQKWLGERQKEPEWKGEGEGGEQV